MAGKIEGVTIEFGGQSVKLETALKNISGQAKLAQKELTEINKNLKFNPKNAELLVQKQKVLQESFATNKKKLEELKKVEEQLANVPGQEEKWRKVKREIISTEKTLKTLEKQQENLNKKMSLIGKLSENYDKVSKKSEEMGKSLLPVSAGLTAIAGVGVKSFSDLDVMFDTVVKKTGATGDALKELKNIAKEVFQSEVAPSAQDAGNAVGELNTRFGFTGEILQKSSIDFLKFAKVTDQDVNTAIIKVSRAMGDAGIDANKYSEVLDALTVAGQQSGIEVGNLTEMLTKFGAPMRQLGFDTKESIALFASWEKAGVNTEIAFSGMKKAIGNWAKEGKDAKVEFKKMLEEIKNAPSLAEATTKSIEVFGQKAGPDLADAIKGGRFEFSEMLKSLENGSGSLETTFKNTQDPMDKFRQTMNRLKVIGAELGEVILSKLAPVLEKISNVVKDVSNWFSNLSDKQKSLIVTFGGIVASLSVVLIAFSKFMFFLKKVYNAFKLVKTAITVFKTALVALKATIVANPIGALVVAIGLIVGAFVVAYKKSETFRKIVDNALKKVGEGFKWLYENAIKPSIDWIIKKWSQMQEFFIQAGEHIKTIFTNIWNGIVAVWDVFWNTFQPIFTGAWEFIKEYFGNLWIAIQGIWSVFSGIFTGDWQLVWNGIKDFIFGLWENIKLIFSTALNILWSVVKSIFTAIWDTIVSIFNGIPGFVSGIWNGAKDIVSNLLNSMWGIVKNLASSIYNSVSDWFSKIPSKISDVWNSAVSYLSSINLASIGRDIIWGLINGIGSMGGALWNAAKNIADRFISSIKSFFGIASPSKVMKAFGVNIGEGLEIGVKNKEFDIVKSGQRLANAFTDGYKSQQKHFKQSFSLNYEIGANSGIISGLNKNLNKINSLKNNLKVDVPVILNGREIARATNKDTDYYQGLRIKKLRGV